MSLILDALRRGRPQPPRRSYGSAAQSDSVAQTLAQRGRNAADARSPAWHLAAYLVSAVVLALGVWSAVVWLTSAFLPPPSPQDTGVPTRSTLQAASSVAAPSPRPPVHEQFSETAVRTPDPTSAAAPTSPPPPADRERFLRGLTAHLRGDLDAAMALYQEAVGINPSNVEAHNNLGLVYRDRKRLFDAEQALQRAVALDPTYARGRNNLGLVLLGQRKLEAAAAAFHAAVAIEPASVDALVNLALVEREAGRRDAARATLRRALDIDPSHAGAHYNLALIEDEAGVLSRALLHYQSFLRHGADRHHGLGTEVRRRILQLESVR